MGNVRTFVLIETARVKQGGVDVAWKLIFCFRGVTYEWISSVFEMSDVFWIAVLSLSSSCYDIVGIYKLKISLTWQESCVFFLSCGIRFKSGMQQYVFLYPTPLQHTPPPPHFPPKYPPPPIENQHTISFYIKIRYSSLLFLLYFCSIRWYFV